MLDQLEWHDWELSADVSLQGLRAMSEAPEAAASVAGDVASEGAGGRRGRKRAHS